MTAEELALIISDDAVRAMRWHQASLQRWSGRHVGERTSETFRRRKYDEMERLARYGAMEWYEHNSGGVQSESYRLTPLGMAVLALRDSSFRFENGKLYRRDPFNGRFVHAKTDWST